MDTILLYGYYITILLILLNLAKKINLKRSDKYVDLSKFCIYRTWTNIKKKNATKIVNLKYQLSHEMKRLNYLMDDILYQIFKITYKCIFKKMEKRLMILQ